MHIFHEVTNTRHAIIVASLNATEKMQSQTHTSTWSPKKEPLAAHYAWSKLNSSPIHIKSYYDSHNLVQFILCMFLRVF